MNRTIRITTEFPHPPALVWRALTDSRILGAWLMQNDIEPQLHHEFTFRMKPQRGWDGMTHCEIIELEPQRRISYSYRGKASGEKPLACASIDSRVADAAAKGIFAELDTVLRFTLTPLITQPAPEQTRLTLEHSGFRGIKMSMVSLIMGSGWHKQLRRLSATLDTFGRDPNTNPAALPQRTV